MWSVWFLLIIIVGLVFHYWAIPNEGENIDYQLNEILVSPFKEEMAKYPEEPDQIEYLMSIRQCMLDSRALSKAHLSPKPKPAKVEIAKPPVEETINATSKPILSLEKPEVINIDTPVNEVPEVTTSVQDAPFITRETNELLAPSAVDSLAAKSRSDILVEIIEPNIAVAADVDENEAQILTMTDIFESYNDEYDEDENVEEEEATVELGFKKSIVTEEHGSKILDLLEIYEDNIEDPEMTMILEALAEYAESDAPSIVQSAQDSEVNEYRNSYEILREVSLFDHIYHVVEEITKQFKNFPGLYHKYVSDYFVMAVYHDIGKLPKFRDGIHSKYRMLDHPLVSADILESRTSDISAEVLDAIRLHHKPIDVINTKYHKALKTADMDARQREIQQSANKVPELASRLTKADVSALIVSKYTSYLKTAVYSNRPLVTVIKGYLLMDKETYFSEIEKHLQRTSGMCREQLASDEQFKSAAISFLVNSKLTTELLQSTVVHLSYRKAGKTRSYTMREYVIFAIESLNLRESELPSDTFGNKYSEIQFGS